MILFVIASGIVGGFIGWITNRLAIKLIFRPHAPFRIGPFYLQGLIPRRRQQIANTIGQVVEKDLLSIRDLALYLSGPGLQSRVGEILALRAGAYLRSRLPFVIPGPVRELLGQAVEEMLRREAPLFLSDLASDLPNELQQELDLAAVIEKKINQLDLNELENLVMRVASSELRHIEVLGALIGFCIGLIQAGLFNLAQIYGGKGMGI